ncbi:MAG: thermonuclease family protein [Candidatus Levybacteria bacterium]|nr:thermonuclease family protein [Candidatus Levybacteria bacterium]
MKIRVKKVIDGDTFQDSRNRFFRLANVNTPEKRERGYQRAKDTLSNLIDGKDLIADVEGISYNRKVIIARSLGEKTTINEKMQKKGYKQKLTDQ